jgi:hypothetical protein
MSSTSPDPLSQHAPSVHHGFHQDDPEFQAARVARADLVRDFLAAMDAAGRPGLRRKLGSTVLQITGQPTEHYWSTVLRDEQGHHRGVLVFDDGSHGWSDEITYSDRPRSDDDEIPPELLQTALDRILTANGLTWPEEHALARAHPAAAAENRESTVEYRHHREVEYAWMMGIRVVCLVAAVVVVALKVPFAALWVALLGLGMIVLPMMAVIIANDHHPRRRSNRNRPRTP